MNREIELLAPAGNWECLKTAFYFGADAVYIAGKSFGLRAFANNFSNDDIAEAIQYAHALGKKIYITVNAVLYHCELEDLKYYLMFLEQAGADAVIVSDPAVVQIVKQNGMKIPLHLSTQANTTNDMAATFWHEQGFERVVLSRELSLAEIAEIRKHTPPTLEIEAFVHGAMCIAHSGRCLLSSVLTNRSGNRGECAQPCRWEYYISEKGYDGEYFNISEDERGTYLMNSRDLMMIEHIPELVEAGITSLKVEGRMKSAYYVASVISAYRRALDAYLEQGQQYYFDKALSEELEKSATRGFTKGFYFGNPRESGQDSKREERFRTYTFIGKVQKAQEDGQVLIEQRNKFCLGDIVEVLSPNLQNTSFKIEQILNESGEEQECAPHPQQLVRINCSLPLQPGDILRRYDEK